jgi:hypothetical protein
MGYYSHVTGSMRVEPRLSDADLKALDLDDDSDKYTTFIGRSGGEDDTVGVVNGQIAVIPGKSYTLIEIRHDDAFKAYDFEAEVADLVATVTKRGHKIEGSLYVAGEENDDRWRMRIINDQKGTRAVQEQPEWVWPNGDKGWG